MTPSTSSWAAVQRVWPTGAAASVCCACSGRRLPGLLSTAASQSRRIVFAAMRSAAEMASIPDWAHTVCRPCCQRALSNP